MCVWSVCVRACQCVCVRACSVRVCVCSACVRALCVHACVRARVNPCPGFVYTDLYM